MKTKLIKGQKAYMSLPVSVKGINKEAHTLTMVASTQDVDRHGDTVIQSGWQLGQFIENPVILNSHNYGDATEVIARATRTEIVGKGKRSRLEQDWEFAVNENPKAKIIFDLYAGGFLHASSVGFLPRKFKENPDGTNDWYIIEEAELLEVSAVSVPANARALAKAKGIDTDILPDNTEDIDEYGDETEPNGEQGNDEIPEGDEVEETDEESASEDGDDSEGGSGDGDDEEDGNTGADIEPEETVIPQEPVQMSYTAKVASAIRNIENERREKYKIAAKAISSLLDEGASHANLDQKTKEQVRIRNVNKAIRTLMQTK